MKIDFNTKILALDGETQVVEQVGDEIKPVTLGHMAINALLTPLPDMAGNQEQTDGQTKVRLATLAQAIYAGGTVDVSVEDVSLIKERIGRCYSALPVMRAWSILDPV